MISQLLRRIRQLSGTNQEKGSHRNSFALQFHGEGIISQKLSQDRYQVRYRASYWIGQSEPNLNLTPGDRVLVRGRIKDSLTLILEPFTQENAL